MPFGRYPVPPPTPATTPEAQKQPPQPLTTPPPLPEHLKQPQGLLQPCMLPREALPVVTTTGQNWRALDHSAAGIWVNPVGEPVSPARLMRFDEAMTSQHTDDLFGVMYGSVPPGSGHPHTSMWQEGYRLTTGAPVAMEEASAGGSISRYQVVGSMFMIDIDLKDIRSLATGKAQTTKMGWTPEIRERFHEDLWEPACLKLPILRRPSLWYTTKHGMRLVYLLDQPIPVLGLRGHFDRYRGLLVDMFLAGIPIDRATKDWTRLQRLPMVCRNETDIRGQVVGTSSTWTEDYFRMSWGRVDVEAIEDTCPPEVLAYPAGAFPAITERVPGIEGYTEHQQFRVLQSLWLGQEASSLAGSLNEHVECGRQPADEEATALLHRDGDQRSPTLLHKKVKDIIVKRAKKTAGSSVYSAAALRVNQVLWEGARLDLISTPPSLHDNLYSVLSDLAYLVQDELGTGGGQVSPQFLYSLLLEPARKVNEARMQDADGTPRDDATLAGEVWRAVTHVYCRRWNHREEARRQEVQDEALVDAYADQQDIRRTIVNYWIDKRWPAEDAEEHWRERLLLVSDAGVSCLMIEDGRVTWSEPSKVFRQWVTEAARSAPSALRLYDEPENGPPRLRGESEICAEFGTVIGSNVCASRIVARTDIECSYSGDKRIPRLIVKFPGVRTDIEPMEHSDVHEWLLAFGGTNPEQFLDHLSTFPDLTMPWPAMYKHGLPDEGKGLIVESLKILTEKQKAADFMDAVGQFQDDFRDTPLLIVNEGSSTANGQFQKSVTEVLRNFIGSDSMKLSQKGKPAIHVEGHCRVVITSNHDNALDWGQNLTQIDEEAIRKRVGFYGPSPRAAEILRLAGGRLGNTHGPGTVVTKWPQRIAEHIMWLHANRSSGVETTGRFALEISNTDWHERQRAKGSGQLLICRAIAAMLRNRSRNEEAIRVVPVAKNKQVPGIYIASEEFYNDINILFMNERQRIPPLEKMIGTLNGMCYAKEERYRVAQRGGVRVRGRRLDIANFLTVLRGHGLNYDYRDELGDAWDEAPDAVKRAVQDGDSADLIDDDPSLMERPFFPANQPPPDPSRKIIQFNQLRQASE